MREIFFDQPGNNSFLEGLIRADNKSRPQGNSDAGKRSEHRPKGSGQNTKGNHNSPKK
jgi:hypothetical protein